MSRLSHEQLNVIKDRLGVDRIWSFSKMSTFEQCIWSYKLKYIDKVKGKEDSCYTYWGTIAHDIRQGFYDGVYKSNDEMLEKLEDEIAKYLMEDKKELKFPNKSEHVGYFDNLRHYFANCSNIEADVRNEKPVIAVLKGNGDKKFAFQGYIDSYYKEDGKHYILDYKTSSIIGFTGEKLLKKSQQLMVYAYGLWKQQGIPIEDIVIKFDMMKYCNVSFLLKNGNTKVTKCERRNWVGNISNQIHKDFEDVPKLIEAHQKKVMQLTKKMNAKCRTPEEVEELKVQIGELENEIKGLEEVSFDVLEINEKISKAIDDNNLSSLPQFIQDKYTVSECMIEVELNQEIIEECIANIVELLEAIVEAESGEHEESFNRNRIVENESYYCNNLCDVRDSCKFYKEYREHLDLFFNGGDKSENSDDLILAMLGL